MMSNARHDPLPVRQLPVGEVLGRELEARGWTQADFAAVIGRPTQFVSEIVTGKKEITRESAAQIAAALDSGPQYWLNLQDRYLLAEQDKNETTQAKLAEVRRRALLSRKGPIQLLQRRGIISGTTLDEIETELLDLFDIKSLDEEPAFAAAAKRSNHGEAVTALQVTWVACIRRTARKQQPAKPYSQSALEDLAKRLPRILNSPEAFTQLPDMLAEAGVRLVFVEALPGAKIDGCALFVDDVPVIGLSGRGKRLDKVLFALLHEIAHIVRGHVNATKFIVEDLDDKHTQEADDEREANAQAERWVFPEGFPPVPARIGAAWVSATASRLGIASIVLVGQLQHRKQLDWRTTLAKNPPTVEQVLAAWM